MGEDEERGAGLKKTLKIFNILVSVILIIFGIVRYFGLTLDIEQPWIVFQPAYTILFGIILILSEMKVQMVTENLKFLSNYTGRGIFVIFLSTIVTGNLTGSDILKYISIIIAIFLLVTGVLYICIHCCCGDKVQEDPKAAETKKLLGDEEKRGSISKVRNPSTSSSFN